MFKVNKTDTGTTSLTSFWYLYCFLGWKVLAQIEALAQNGLNDQHVTGQQNASLCLK